MTAGQFTIWFVCAVALAWAFYPQAKRAARRVIGWFRPESLAPWRYPGGDR